MKRVMNIFQKLMFNNVQYLEKLHELYNSLSFFREKMKIEKVEKLVASSNDKSEHVIHIRNLRPALNHRLVLEKVYRVTKFNQNGWLKPLVVHIILI